ncbi:hypothetical protein ACGFNP_25685 [Nonomuraea sp. NPDC049269]|uniref:hypothetical protein n=1 Tax=Nonomuraea sp. NPDC049269 TaxID=3364349 RepID=UPI003717CD61
MLERTFTFKQAAEHLQVVSVYWLKQQVRAGNIECTPLGRKRVFTESQLAKIATDGVELPGQRPRKKRANKQATAKPRAPRPAPAVSDAPLELVFDRSRSRNFRKSGTA